MSDLNDPRNTLDEVPDGQENLLRDLRALPRINAPMDFAHHLRRRIAEEDTTTALPWWKRLFIPAAKGGLHLPGYAYGAAGAAVVLIVSVYVFQTTNVEQQLQDEIPREQRILPQHTTIDDEEPQSADEQTSESDGKAMKETAIDADVKDADGPVEPLPATPSVSTQKSGRDGLQQKGESSNKMLRRQIVPPGEHKSKVQSEEALEENFAPTLRGVMMEDEVTPLLPLDSAAHSDSLRKLDSLRRLNLDREPRQENNPR